MYLNLSETRQSMKLEIYMKCHNKDMQVRFNNSVLHFDKGMPFLSLQINIQSNIKQYVVFAL